MENIKIKFVLISRKYLRHFYVEYFAQKTWI